MAVLEPLPEPFELVASLLPDRLRKDRGPRVELEHFNVVKAFIGRLYTLVRMLHEFFLESGTPLSIVKVDEEREGEDNNRRNKGPPQVVEQHDCAEEQHEWQRGYLREVSNHENQFVSVNLHEIDHLARCKLLVGGR